MTSIDHAVLEGKSLAEIREDLRDCRENFLTLLVSTAGMVSLEWITYFYTPTRTPFVAALSSLPAFSTAVSGIKYLAKRAEYRRIMRETSKLEQQAAYGQSVEKTS